MDLTSPQITMRDREITQLKEELAKERERAETRELALDAAVSSSCVLGAELAKERNKLEMAEAVIAGDGALITGLKNELAAAQATIEQMREALKEMLDWYLKHSNLLHHPTNEKAELALAIPTNLDALHEARALECERLADVAGDEPEHVKSMFSEWLREEAAAHRARKQPDMVMEAYAKHERSLGAEKAMASDLRERNAAWWALVMGAAAALEDAANFSDSDAKRAAEGAASHYRREANALWQTVTTRR